MVSRLSDPYGDCRDPNDVDKMHNAYAEHFPIGYTSQVLVLVHLYADERRSSCFNCLHPVPKTCRVCFENVGRQCFDDMLRESIPSPFPLIIYLQRQF